MNGIELRRSGCEEWRQYTKTVPHRQRTLHVPQGVRLAPDQEPGGGGSLMIPQKTPSSRTVFT